MQDDIAYSAHFKMSVSAKCPLFATLWLVQGLDLKLAEVGNQCIDQNGQMGIWFECVVLVG